MGHIEKTRKPICVHLTPKLECLGVIASAHTCHQRGYDDGLQRVPTATRTSRIRQSDQRLSKEKQCFGFMTLLGLLGLGETRDGMNSNPPSACPSNVKR